MTEVHDTSEVSEKGENAESPSVVPIVVIALQNITHRNDRLPSFRVPADGDSPNRIFGITSCVGNAMVKTLVE